MNRRFFISFVICLFILTFTAGSAFAKSDKDKEEDPKVKSEKAKIKVLNKVKAYGKKYGITVIEKTYKSDGLKVGGFLFYPKTDKKLPCVIFSHDGIYGISKQHGYSCVRLAKEGYVVYAPSYRGEDGYDGEIEIAKGEVNDVDNAMKMVSKLKIVDSNRIALAGASHGALISLLLASKRSNVKAVVSAYGVADIYKWYKYLKENKKLGKDKITRRTYGDGPKDQPESFKIRNAVYYVKNIKAPVLILQGKKDKVVPWQQAVLLKKALDEAGVKNTLKLYPDCLHGFLIYAPYIDDADKMEKEQTEEAWSLMIKFLKENL